MRMSMQSMLTGMLLLGILSCSKDKDDNNNSTKTLEQLLTEKAWKADEIRVQLSNNTKAYYKRGAATGNTANYDSDSVRFNTNNTGIYYFQGIEYTTTWNFVDADKTKMTLVINYPSPLTVNLENIQITQSFFKYAQYATDPAGSYLASGTRRQN
jgi:hypothetical protein